MKNTQTITTPSGVVFEKAEIKCLKCYKECEGKVAIISRDEDYFSLAKSIKDTLEDAGATVENIALDDGFSNDLHIYENLFRFDDDVNLFIAVGSASMINLVRAYLCESDKRLIAVPTEVAFMSIFSEKVLIGEHGVAKQLNAKCSDLVVFDLKFMAGLKKQSFADAFCEVSSKLIALVDYKAQKILNGDDSGSANFIRAFKIIEGITKIDKFEGCYIKIINAEYNFALLLKEENALGFGAESYVAHLLNLMKSGSTFENAFFTVTPLIKLYEAFLRVDMLKTPVVPNYNKRLYELSLLCGGAELDFIKNYKPMEFNELCAYREKLVKSDLLGFIKTCARLCEKLKSTYNCIYKGKQKRAGFETSELNRALILAPYLSGGLLQLISDSGVCECFE